MLQKIKVGPFCHKIQTAFRNKYTKLERMEVMMVWNIFVPPQPKYFCWKHQQKISKIALRSIKQTFPLLNWQKMPRMHHGVSLLNDAKIREEASVWSAGLCGFYFCVFSSQNIARIRLLLLSTGWWISWISQEIQHQDQVRQSCRSLGWLKSYQSPDWLRWNRSFLSTPIRAGGPGWLSPQVWGMFSGRVAGRVNVEAERGEDDHDTELLTSPPGWKVTQHQRSVSVQIWGNVGDGPASQPDRWNLIVIMNLTHLVSVMKIIRRSVGCNLNVLPFLQPYDEIRVKSRQFFPQLSRMLCQAGLEARQYSGWLAWPGLYLFGSL